MPRPYEQYAVHSYFINVADGDGAVHLLLRNKKVQAAVLIDGGREPATARLRMAIEYLQKEYKNQGQNEFKFNTIIVTHYDEDHFEALFKILSTDTKEEDLTFIDKNTKFFCPAWAMPSSKRKFGLSVKQLPNDSKWSLVYGPDTKVCEAIHGENCIGYDFFTGKNVKQPGGFQNLDKVYQRVDDLSNMSRPVFLCVSADEKFIDGNFINDPNVKRIGTKKNRSSIMAVVLWPTGTHEKRISLYTGGDAEESHERHLIKWIGSDTVLDVVKAGHHGSHFASPETMFEFKNQAFITSAGHGHGHPSLAIVFFVLLIARLRIEKKEGKLLIASTRYPYWLALPPDQLDDVKFNISKILGFTPEAQGVFTGLKDLSDGGHVKFYNELREASDKIAGAVYLQYSEKQIKEFQRNWENTPLGQSQLKDWKKPKRPTDPQVLAEAIEDLKAEAGAETMRLIRNYWANYAVPDSENSEAIQFVCVKATSDPEIKLGTIRNPAYINLVTNKRYSHKRRTRKQWDKDGINGPGYAVANPYISPGVNTAVGSGMITRRKNIRKSRKRKGGKYWTSDNDDDEFLVGIHHNTSDVSQRLLDLFTSELAAHPDLPSVLDHFRHDSDDSDLIKWFTLCFLKSPCALLFTGVGGAMPQVSLRQIDLEIKLSGHQVLVFSSSLEAKRAQFGEIATDGSQTEVFGFDRRFGGMLFALDTAASDGNFSLAEVASLLRYELSPDLKDLFNKAQLRLRNSQNTRSGLWFVPSEQYATVMRLEFQPQDQQLGIPELEDLVQQALGAVLLDHVIVTATLTSQSISDDQTSTSASLVLKANINWKDTTDALSSANEPLCVRFLECGFEILLMFRKGEGTEDELAKIVAKVQERLGLGQPDELSLQKNAQSVATKLFDMIKTIGASEIHVRSVSILIDQDKKPINFQMKLEAGLAYGKNHKIAPFLVKFCWQSGTMELSAQLWNKTPWYYDIPEALFPYHDDSNQLKSWTGNNYTGKLSLLEVMGAENMKLPAGIPDEIDHASLSLIFEGKTTIMVLSADLICNTEEIPQTKRDVPEVLFEEVHLMLMQTSSHGNNPEIKVHLGTTIRLCLPSIYQNVEIAEVVYAKASVDYVGSADYPHWIVTASIVDVRVANLFDILPEDGSSFAIVDTLGALTIDLASIEYQYHGDMPSSLKIDGTLILGPHKNPVALKLGYSHKDNKWKFDAEFQLVDTEKVYKLADLLSGLVEDESALPEIVRNLEIPLGKLKLNVNCSSAKDETETKHAICTLTIEIEDKFKLVFAQIRSYGGDIPREPATPGRLLRFILTKLPEVPELPMVGKVKLPFDQLGFVWVNREFSANEIEILNKEVFKRPHEKLLVKQVKEDKVNFASGVHFQIALLERNIPKLVLDHVAKAKKKPQGPKENVVDILNDDTSNSGPSVAPLTKDIGPLSVRNIGLSVEGSSYSKLRVSLDAILHLGPTAFELIDFSLAIDLSGIKRLEELSSFSVTPSFGGMAAAFEKPPTRIAGTLSRFVKPSGGSHGFQGGVMVSVKEWNVIAGGVYEEYKSPRGDIQSFFVFGMLQGPIAQIGCAEIHNVTGGFGYNSRIDIPPIDDVTKFPFITMMSGKPRSGGALDQLEAFMKRDGNEKGFIHSSPGDMWLVAGLGVKAFQSLEVEAVLVLTLSARPKFSILGRATAVFPRNTKRDPSAENPFPDAFLLVDMALSAVLDTEEHTISIFGQLTSNSFIFNPSCRLTGGFGTAVFLPGSPREGDWVFSVGGYHPSFSKPSHYPTVRDRVGIKWKYDDNIYVSGEAYFALTPQVAMGGGRLDLVFDKGWLRVVFSAYADFFMHFHPFQFEASVGIAIYASATVDVGFYTDHFGPKEFSAKLKLRGPPLAGEVQLKLWRWDVTVCFGRSQALAPPLDLNKFIRMVKNLSQDAGDTPDHLFSITKGALTPKQIAGNQDSKDIIEIRGSHLHFQLQSYVPVRSANIGGNDRHDTVTADGRAMTPEIYSRPMQQGREWQESHLTIRLVAEKDNKDISLTATPIYKAMPPALWGKSTSTMSPDKVAKEALLQHVVGYQVAVDAGKGSQKTPPIMNVKTINIGTGPKIPVVENLVDDRVLAIGKRNEFSELTAEKAGEMNPAKSRALAAWKRFKKGYSHEGSDTEAEPLLTST